MTEFHLLRPWWLLALVPALLLFWYGRHKHKTQTGWHHVLPAHLAHLLIDSQPSRQSTRLWHGLLLAWLMAILALSGPTWQKLPQPLFEVNSGKVVVLDMSLSMYATDMAPNRLTRARFKTVDLLKQLPEGETGLVAFAGDGFVISPLTTDINNLLNLLPALSPEIMPAYGSEAQYGIEKAIELLEKAGYQQGDIFLITDGVNQEQQKEIQDLLGNRDYRLSVLAVGSDKPAPIKLPNGQLLKDNSGNIVLPRVDRQVLSQLASRHGGLYRDLSADDSDIRALSNQVPLDRQGQQSTDQFGDAWHEAGPWLLLIMLPFASLAFRRGLLAISVALLFSTSMPQPAMAAEQAPIAQTATDTEASGDWRESVRQGWNSLWHTGDQRGAQHFSNQEFDRAAGTFDNSQWQGAAHYRNGDYQKALEAYQQQDDARGHYNQGNALAQLGRYDDAIEQYREALAQEPGLEDAQKNIELLEKLKQQQEQQQQQSQDGQQGDQSQQDQQQQSGQDQESGEQSDQQQQDQSQQSQDGEQSDESEQQSGSDQQSPPSQDEQQQQQSEQQESQAADGEQNEQEQQSEQQQQAQQQSGAEQQDGEQTPEGQQPQGHFDQQDLSPEERQRLNQLMKKIPDDPSLLLRNKMLLEAQKRRRQGITTKEKQNW